MPFLHLNSFSSIEDLANQLTRFLNNARYPESTPGVKIEDIVHLITKNPEEIDNPTQDALILKEIALLLNNSTYKDWHGILLFHNMCHLNLHQCMNPQNEIIKDVNSIISQQLPHHLNPETHDLDLVRALTGLAGQGLMLKSITCSSFLIEQLIKNLISAVEQDPNSPLASTSFNAVYLLLEHGPQDGITKEQLETLKDRIEYTTFNSPFLDMHRRDQFMPLLFTRLAEKNEQSSYSPR